MTDVHDLEDDRARYLAEALKIAGHDWVELDTLADNYTLPKPNNLAELREDIKDELGQTSGKLDEHDAKRWLIRRAVVDINADNPGAIEIGTTGDFFYDGTRPFRLAEGVDVDTLKVRGELLIQPPKLPDLFNPETGKWRENVRSYTAEGFKELRESMRQLGWLRQLPAIQDENGVIIVGHRRLDVAEELGIEPVIETVRFGEGVAGDAARAALAIASNVGAEKISPADRRKIAADLYGSGWSMAKIGDLLKVATMTVSRDLRGLTHVKPVVPQRNRGGRPRKEPAPEKQSEKVTEGPSGWAVGIRTVCAGERDGQPVYDVMKDDQLIKAALTSDEIRTLTAGPEPQPEPVELDGPVELDEPETAGDEPTPEPPPKPDVPKPPPVEAEPAPPRPIDTLIAELVDVVAELERHCEAMTFLHGPDRWGDQTGEIDPREVRHHPFTDGAYKILSELHDDLHPDEGVVRDLSDAEELRAIWPTMTASQKRHYVREMEDDLDHIESGYVRLAQLRIDKQTRRELRAKVNARVDGRNYNTGYGGRDFDLEQLQKLDEQAEREGWDES
ncbi:hypothetical protein [Mycobacterium sp.]|uniref:hypothetical protein n=1 Tax=Mycobacterium sp. TaxID=1785 RepID=UPI003F9A7C85